MDKEELLNRRIEAIRLKNEEIKRRHAEVEADKRNAEALGSSQIKKSHNRRQNTSQEPDINQKKPLYRSFGRGRKYNNAPEKPIEQHGKSVGAASSEHSPSEYETWKSERQKIDSERIIRHKVKTDTWQLDWDKDKLDLVKFEEDHQPQRRENFRQNGRTALRPNERFSNNRNDFSPEDHNWRESNSMKKAGHHQPHPRRENFHQNNRRVVSRTNDRFSNNGENFCFENHDLRKDNVNEFQGRNQHFQQKKGRPRQDRDISSSQDYPVPETNRHHVTQTDSTITVTVPSFCEHDFDRVTPVKDILLNECDEKCSQVQGPVEEASESVIMPTDNKAEITSVVPNDFEHQIGINFDATLDKSSESIHGDKGKTLDNGKEILGSLDDVLDSPSLVANKRDQESDFEKSLDQYTDLRQFLDSRESENETRRSLRRPIEANNVVDIAQNISAFSTSKKEISTDEPLEKTDDVVSIDEKEKSVKGQWDDESEWTDVESEDEVEKNDEFLPQSKKELLNKESKQYTTLCFT